MTTHSTSSASLKGAKVFAASVVGAGLVIGMIVAATFGASALSSTADNNCAGLAEAARTQTKGKTVGEPIDLIVAITTNSEAGATEARDLVRATLSADDPTASNLVKVTLLLGGHQYRPTGVADEVCFESTLLVSASPTDIDAYKEESSAEDESRLREQYRDRVDHVADAVEEAVRAAPAPAPETLGGMYWTWGVVATVPEGHRAVVLDTFDLTADTCLRFTDARELLHGELISQRVSTCLKKGVGGGGISPAKATSVRLVPSTALGLDTNQITAQANVVKAFCTLAASCTN